MILILKSLVAWVGGKAKLMWLINLLSPKNYERSIDIFGGSGTVTLNLESPRNCFRVYNDFNGDLVNLMQCARDKTFALVKEIGFLALNSRGDFEVCKKFLNREEFTDNDLKEELDLTEILFETPTEEEVKALLISKAEEKDVRRAAMYYKVLRYSFNANGETFGGRKLNLLRLFFDIWYFAKAFSEVTIENKHFEALIRQYDRVGAFLYADPPYYDAEGFYEVGFPKEYHVRLRDTLKSAQRYVMVSYNNVPEVRELYEDFYIYLTTRPHSMSKKEGELYEELIITNYDPTEHMAEKSMQINLFGEWSSMVFEGNFEMIHKPNKPSMDLSFKTY